MKSRFFLVAPAVLAVFQFVAPAESAGRHTDHVLRKVLELRDGTRQDGIARRREVADAKKVLKSAKSRKAAKAKATAKSRPPTPAPANYDYASATAADYAGYVAATAASYGAANLVAHYDSIAPTETAKVEAALAGTGTIAGFTLASPLEDIRAAVDAKYLQLPKFNWGRMLGYRAVRDAYASYEENVVHALSLLI